MFLQLLRSYIDGASIWRGGAAFLLRHGVVIIIKEVHPFYNFAGTSEGQTQPTKYRSTVTKCVKRLFLDCIDYL